MNQLILKLENKMYNVTVKLLTVKINQIKKNSCSNFSDTKQKNANKAWVTFKTLKISKQAIKIIYQQ